MEVKERLELVTTDEPTTIYRPVFRCSNCGSLIAEDDTSCEACQAKFGTIVNGHDHRIIRHPEYTKESIITMIQMVPNGQATTDGIGGIGEVISNHYIQMGVKPSGNDLSWKGVSLAITLIRSEGYAPSIMIIHPYQMIDLLQYEEFVGTHEKAYQTIVMRAPSRDGVIGTFAGMQVIVSSNMSPGYALIFDDERFGNFDDAERSAAVLLYGGRTELWGQ